ncbi:DUF748 domain-containing protein [Pantoea sp. 18069]|uniref:DUF748 domain-containing protein n=1 Tax=Pantoea sp. 18069 TaxID=2681415 RepID=UPI0013582100|nr:DUF748 domain-containing protein [Pantoea sp. 18069]
MKSLNKKRALRHAALALSALLALWLLLWLAVPVVLKSQIQRLGSEKLGRAVTLESAQFKPWTLELTLNGLRIAGLAGAQQPLLSVQRIYIDAQVQSLLRLAPVLDAIEVNAPVLHLAQTSAGRYDVDDILQRLADAAAPEDKAAPQRFALYNIKLRGGSVDFHDALVERTHQVRALELSLPFLSTLASGQKVRVAPRLAFALNGSAFDSSALSTPFLESRATQLRLAFKGLDLADFLGYLPRSLPVQIAAGRLDADLEMDFEQAAQAQVHVRGQLALHQAQLHDAQGQELLQFERLDVALRDVQPLRQQVLVDSVRLTGPQLRAGRDARGVINWLALAGPGQTADAPASKPAPWHVEVAQVTVAQGRAEWRDQSADAGAQGAHLQFADIALQARALALPLTQPVQFDGRMTLASAAAPKGGAAPGVLAFKGQATATQGQVGVTLESVPLGLGASYLSARFKPLVQGRATARLGLAWNGETTVVKVARLALDDLALQDKAARMRQLLLEDADLRLPAQSLRIGQLTLDQPVVGVQRDARGRWMFEPWLATPASAPAKADAPQRPWNVLLQSLVIDGGQVNYRDALPVRPVQWQASGVALKVRDFAPLSQTAKASPLQLSLRMAGSRRAQAGRLAYDGSLRVAPLLVQGMVRASELPLHAFEPYVADLLNVRLLRADGGFTGRVRYEDVQGGPRLSLRGDVQLNDLRAQAAPAAQGAAPAGPNLGGPGLAGSEDLLRWKVLALRGLDLVMAPGVATRVRLRETALSDFHARVIVQPDGRINLQDIVKSRQQQAAGQAVDAAPSQPEPAGPAPVVHIGPVVLSGGTVAFSDYFIQPNYSADLSALAGRLGAFSSETAPDQPPQMADLALRGRAQGTANLEITGQLNPLAKPLALDVTARMSDLELSPLSPYAIKYAGHGIERGKLSMDVNYRIQPDGQLTASNKLVLNQLTFGEAVEGAPASLPVRLATALLADRNGVIDLDLPISGSLNDPQFRLAPVIFKIIGNLIMKAVTAPFALLSGAFGGDAASSGAVVFAPGSAELDAAGRQALDKIAQALQARPALQMTVVGEAALAAERAGWQQVQVQQMLGAEKRRQALRAGQAADRITAVAPAEESALLKAVYARADIKKPRNLLGMAKDLPDNEMRTLLQAHVPVPDNAMRELALARAVVVRDYLAAQELPLKRLFLGAPVQPLAGPDWKPQARLELALR